MASQLSEGREMGNSTVSFAGEGLVGAPRVRPSFGPQMYAYRDVSSAGGSLLKSLLESVPTMLLGWNRGIVAPFLQLIVIC